MAFGNSAPEQRRIVIYSEGKTYWPFLRPFVRALLEQTDEKFSYVSSEADDPGLCYCPERMSGYVIGSGFCRTWWFGTLEARVLLMTMPDLHVYHLKRSKAHPVHYIYANHGCDSLHMVLREQAVDYFDTVFCSGPHNVEEIRKREAMKGLKAKNLVEVGYPYQDELIDATERAGGTSKEITAPLRVLLAPSWSEKGLGTIETVGERLVACLLDAGFHVTVRPHPQTRRLQPRSVATIASRFARHTNFVFEESTTGTASLMTADILISDWSAIALEFAFSRLRPVLYIDVPRKAMNPNYEELGIEPFEVRIRGEVGAVLLPTEIERAPEIIEKLCENAEGMAKHIRQIRDGNVYNIGRSAEVGAKAIVDLANIY